MLDIVGEKIVQEYSGILAGGADRPELRQRRQHRIRCSCLELGKRIAEIARFVGFEARTAACEEVLPVFVHGFFV
jgi:hypothetical protein